MYKNPKKFENGYKMSLIVKITISDSIFHMYEPENPKLYEEKRSIMAQNQPKMILLSNYRIGWKSGSHYGFIGKLALFPGLAHPPYNCKGTVNDTSRKSQPKTRTGPKNSFSYSLHPPTTNLNTTHPPTTSTTANNSNTLRNRSPNLHRTSGYYPKI